MVEVPNREVLGHDLWGEGDSRIAETATRDEPATLLQLARDGDRAGWDGLVDRFAGLVWAVARSFHLSGPDAADVSQTTWLRLMENLDRIREPDRVGAWLATTARRESLRLIRLSKRTLPVGDEEHLDFFSEDAKTLEDLPFMSADRRKVVEGLLACLPRRQQLILRLLSADEGLSYQEISEAFDIPIGSIGPTRARALERLHHLCIRAGITEP